MGREMAGRTVRLSESPVYLAGAAGQAKEVLGSLEFAAAEGGAGR